MGEQVTGRVKVKMDGELLRSEPGASVTSWGGPKRTPMANDQGSTDFKVENKPGQIKATIHHVASTDIPAIRAFQGGTVIFETDTNHVYTMDGAFTEDVGELKDGKVEVTFGGDPIE
jgi:hypothetical protein